MQMTTTRMAILIVAAALLGTAPEIRGQTLSKEGQDQKAIHDYLFGSFIAGRETKFVGSGPDRGLKEVTVLTETKEISHGEDVLLPEGVERVAGLRPYRLGYPTEKVSSVVRTLCVWSDSRLNHLQLRI